MAEQHFFVEAKNKAEAEFTKSTSGVRQYVESFLTSRLSMAIFMALFVAFAATAIYAPSRLAPLVSLDLQQQGLIAQGPALDLSDFNVTAAQQQQQVQNAVSQVVPYVTQAYGAAEAKFPALPFWINVLGAIVSFAGLIYTARIQVRAAAASTRSIAI